MSNYFINYLVCNCSREWINKNWRSRISHHLQDVTSGMVCIMPYSDLTKITCFHFLSDGDLLQKTFCKRFIWFAGTNRRQSRVIYFYFGQTKVVFECCSVVDFMFLIKLCS